MELLVILLCAVVIGLFVVRFILKVRAERQRNDAVIPTGLRDVLYTSSNSSGRSLKSWKTRIGAAKNCLKIVVTRDYLYTGVPNPLLRTVTRLYDLEHRIPKNSIEAVEPTQHFLSRQSYRIRYRDEQGETLEIELWPKRRQEFERALGNMGLLTRAEERER